MKEAKINKCSSWLCVSCMYKENKTKNMQKLIKVLSENHWWKLVLVIVQKI